MSGSSACTIQNNNRLANTQTFSVWYRGHADAINTYLTTLTSAPGGDQRSDLATRASDIMNMSVCLQEKVSSNSSLSNEISAAQEQILDLNDQIKAEEANSAIAKDRVAYIRHPEQTVSDYESWFPIDRPIHTFSLLVIMSISLFVSIFSILMLCSFLGVDITLYMRPSQANVSGPFYWIYSQVTPLTVFIFIILVSVLAYFLNRS